MNKEKLEERFNQVAGTIETFKDTKFVDTDNTEYGMHINDELMVSYSEE